MRYTKPIRRGFGILIERKLEAHVEEFIEWAKARDMITTLEVKDLRAAVAYIKQEGTIEATPIVDLPAEVSTEPTPIAAAEVKVF